MIEDINFNRLKVNGIKVNYFYICHRKLWLFDRKITMEDKSDKVLLGALLHMDSYERERQKEVLIDNLISIDILDGVNIKEVKYSDKMEKADKMQVLYYLYYLKNLGIEKQGIINYPKQKKREFIQLTEEAEKEFFNTNNGSLKKLLKRLEISNKEAYNTLIRDLKQFKVEYLDKRISNV